MSLSAIDLAPTGDCGSSFGANPTHGPIDGALSKTRSEGHGCEALAVLVPSIEDPSLGDSVDPLCV